MWICIISISFSYSAAMAESFEAKNVSYHVELKEDNVGRVCHLIMIVTNYPNRPEGVRAEFSMALPRATHTIYTSFIVDVIDIQNDGKAATKIPIISAVFHSKTLNSEGVFYPMDMHDGSVGGSTIDIDANNALWWTIVQGDYSIEFTRQDTLIPRSYHITTPPSVEEFGKMNVCVQSLQKLMQ